MDHFLIFLFLQDFLVARFWDIYSVSYSQHRITISKSWYVKKITSKGFKYQHVWAWGKEYGSSDLKDKKGFSGLICSVWFFFQCYMTLARAVWCCELAGIFNLMNNSQLTAVIPESHDTLSHIPISAQHWRNIILFLESVVISWRVSALQLNINKNSCVLTCIFLPSDLLYNT